MLLGNMGSPSGFQTTIWKKSSGAWIFWCQERFPMNFAPRSWGNFTSGRTFPISEGGSRGRSDIICRASGYPATWSVRDCGRIRRRFLSRRWRWSSAMYPMQSCAGWNESQKFIHHMPWPEARWGILATCYTLCDHHTDWSRGCS